jgi:hypothetical protein
MAGLAGAAAGGAGARMDSTGSGGDGGGKAGSSRVEAGTFIAEALTKAGVLDAETASSYGTLFSRFMRHTRKITLDW